MIGECQESCNTIWVVDVTDLLVFRRASRASNVSSLDAERLPSPLCGDPVFPRSCSADTLSEPMKAHEQPCPGTYDIPSRPKVLQIVS